MYSLMRSSIALALLLAICGVCNADVGNSTWRKLAWHNSLKPRFNLLECIFQERDYRPTQVRDAEAVLFLI